MSVEASRMKCLAAALALAGFVAGAMTAQADEAGQAAGKPEAGHEAAPEPAPSKDWSATVGLDWYTEYIFRGLDLLKNDPVFVPSVIAKYKAFTFSYFGYYGDLDIPGESTYEETDLSLDYTATFFDGKVGLTGGFLAYIYPNGVSGADTYEVYGKATYTHYLNPFVALNWDVDEFHGGYGVVGISHAYDLTEFLHLKEGMSLSVIPAAQVGIDLGYNSKKEKSNVAFNDVLLGVNVPFYITPALCIHAQVQASIALDSLSDIGQNNELIGNAGISYSF